MPKTIGCLWKIIDCERDGCGKSPMKRLRDSLPMELLPLNPSERQTRPWRSKIFRLTVEEQEWRHDLLAHALQGDKEARRILKEEFGLIWWVHEGEEIIAKNRI